MRHLGRPGVALAAVVLTACTGSPGSSTPTPNHSGTSQARSVTLVVAYRGSDLPGSAPNNHPSPREVLRAAHANRCEFWSMMGQNNGGAVAAEVHLLVPTDFASSAQTAVKRLPGVEHVLLTDAGAFNETPMDAPEGSGPYTCGIGSVD